MTISGFFAHLRHLSCTGFAALVFVACTPSLPPSAELSDRPAPVVPYQSCAVIPPNISPLNFLITTDASESLAHIYNRSGSDMILRGPEVEIPQDRWADLLRATIGDTVFIDIYVGTEGRWTRYPSVCYIVAPDEIDPYISYRLIQPSYVTYEDILICQRDLRTFDEQVVYSNAPFAHADEGQCVNCHNYQNYNRDQNFQLHLRERLGGTIISYEGRLHKVGLKTDSTLNAGAYPAWHPSLPLIAYSVNATGQVFHTLDAQKVEVIDFGSDLILYDINKNQVYDLGSRRDEYESFPCWSPDGQTLYYTSAHYEQRSDNIDAELDSAYQDLKYNICRRRFSAATLTFGPADTVFNARAIGKSASLPRVSPDGRYLLFGLADYGNFHIWHHSADLAVIDLSQPADSLPLSFRLLDAANSPVADSYHTWSSNGRWIIFSSRRDDSNYSRPYICYFDTDGRAHRAFQLPQRSPRFYHQFFKSYNVPEFMTRPIEVPRHDLLRVAQDDAQPATFAGHCALP